MKSKTVSYIFIVIMGCVLCTAQENVLVSINIDYRYQFLDGDAAGGGNCTGCWDYYNASAFVDLASNLNPGTGFEMLLTDLNSVDLVFFQRNTRNEEYDPTTNGTQFNCSYDQIKDEFSNTFVDRCLARVDKSFKTIDLGGSVTYGNANSTNMSCKCNNAYSKVWLLAYESPTEIDGNRGLCDPLFTKPGVQVSDGYWEYQVGEATTCTEITDATYRSQFPLNATVEELDAIIDDDLTQAINIKLRFTLTTTGAGMYSRILLNNGGYPTDNTSIIPETDTYALPIYTFTLISCSPQLTQPIDPIHTTCSYSTDGSFSMVLDRNLDNERLIVALYKVGANGDELVDNDDTRGPLAPNGDGTYTYTWNGGALARGTYKIKYQTDNEAEGSEIEPPPDSLEFSAPFTIGGPDPVTFVVETPTHVSCNGNTDGSVTLSAGGGVGGYRYILNNGTAIPFTDTSKDASHVVNNLGPASHTFKVQDADGCMAKEQ